MFRYTEIGSLIQSDPEKASKKLTKELGKYDFNQSATARAMGIPVRTLTRWMSKVASLGFPATPIEIKKTT